MACWLQLYKFGFPWTVRLSGELHCPPNVPPPSAICICSVTASASCQPCSRRGCRQCREGRGVLPVIVCALTRSRRINEKGPENDASRVTDRQDCHRAPIPGARWQSWWSNPSQVWSIFGHEYRQKSLLGCCFQGNPPYGLRASDVVNAPARSAIPAKRSYRRERAGLVASTTLGRCR